MNTLAKEKVTLVDTRIAAILEELLDLMAHNRGNTVGEIRRYYVNEGLTSEDAHTICEQLKQKLKTNCTAKERPRISRLMQILTEEKQQTQEIVTTFLENVPQALLHR